MGNHNNIEQRLIDLEIKASYTEDLLDQLDQVIVRQQQQIENLQHQITRLQVQSEDTGADSRTRNLRDELPPHY